MSLLYKQQVRDVLKAEGITPQELERMVAQGALTRVHGATRRYHNWLFEINQDGSVERMCRYLPGDEHVREWENHADCFGWGCPTCGWRGEISCN